MIRNLPHAARLRRLARASCPPGARSCSTTSSSGVDGVDVDDVYLGNGVSELISMALQALLDDGDEVLIPAPDYPLWTAVDQPRRRHGRCTTSATSRRTGCPTSTTSSAKITDRTKAIVVINPNNPTGAVYPRRDARGHRRARPPARPDGLRRRDLRQDPLRRRRAHPDRRARPRPAHASPSTACRRPTGWPASAPAGWSSPGPKQHAGELPRGPDDPGQHAAVRQRARRSTRSRSALGGRQSINDLVAARRPAARAARRARGELLNEIPGVTLRQAARARCTCSRASTRRSTRSRTTSSSSSTCCASEKILVVQGTGFNWPDPDHFRIVTLPRVADLEDAIGRIGRFLSTYRQV